MTEPRFDPRSPGVRRLARACLAAADTVEVRVLPNHMFQTYEDLGPDGSLPEPIIHRPGDVFSTPRAHAAELVERGCVELV